MLCQALQSNPWYLLGTKLSQLRIDRFPGSPTIRRVPKVGQRRRIGKFFGWIFLYFGISDLAATTSNNLPHCIVHHNIHYAKKEIEITCVPFINALPLKLTIYKA